ncbi:rhomboid family intramembrane serine protease [Amycolatopsis suaedae]|uniref:Rhomboid family intramembrane serine protease n=2 Tax=Amycolatopsis suaedae TaxID=2510978 RepID=A0A4Q7JDY9_9PSEU|nr:rhomboid family intramembrane serine protease [Amycolatopsis suaedae]
MPGCWWHPNRPTGLRCTRCERPACPDCLREASVGSQCIDCVQAGRQQDRTHQVQYRRAGYGARTLVGARPVQTPVVTPLLIAVNVIVYVLTAYQSGDPMNNQRSEIYQYGSLQSLAVSGLDEWWRLLTSGFLHAGIIHVAVNMFSLWILGRDLEPVLGRVRFLALYLLSLLGGSVAVFYLENPILPTVGASGAIYGLLGALLVAVLRLKLNAGGVLLTIGLNIVITFTIPNLSLWGHLGGLAAGALVMGLLVYAPDKGKAGWQTGMLLAVLVALAGLVFFRDAQLGEALCGVYEGQIYCAA